ncbi:MBL fold metallo-hydrolase [Bermanella sp. R86510]|uniref:MBL fold metallo-hydrolase n=1 Tax=unclassified Bermanella TaxID=2627862 RepID=UPI0037C63B2D
MSQVTPLENDIFLLDTGFQRPQMAACYALKNSQDRWAVVETGTKDTVPKLLAFFQDQDVALEQVDYVIVTHVHLDHAGGAGLLMQSLPNARLLVHEKGARHMIAPAKLQAGATAVYGEEEFTKTYGDLIPVDEGRVDIMADGQELNWGNRILTFIDTPGHANHHFCIFDSQSRGIFTGDTFGLAYKELVTANGPFIFPTTTPVQFDPEALKASIQRLMGLEPEVMFLTHFGDIYEPQHLALSLCDQVDELVQLAHKYQGLEESLQVDGMYRELMALLLKKLQKHGCERPLSEQKAILDSDVLLNSKGLFVYNQRQATQNTA